MIAHGKSAAAAELAASHPDESPCNTSLHPSPAPSSLSSSARSTASRSWFSSVRRPRTSPGPRPSPFHANLLTGADDDDRRDSALAPSTSTPSTDSAADPNASAPSPRLNSKVRKPPSLPTIVVQSDPSRLRSASHAPAECETSKQPPTSFRHIDIDFSAGDFNDLMSPTKLQFSKRGSMLLGGKRARLPNQPLEFVRETICAAPDEQKPHGQHQAREQPPQLPQPDPPPPASHPVPPSNSILTPAPTPARPRSSRSVSRVASRSRATSTRVLSADEMTLSRKVRSMYRHGNENAADWEDPVEEADSHASAVDSSSALAASQNGSSLTVDKNEDRRSVRCPSIEASRRESFIVKETTEAAGGVEDWADLDGVEVDRYGFILPKKTTSGGEAPAQADGPDSLGIPRVSTVLQVAASEPRRRRLGRATSKARSARSPHSDGASPKRRASQNSKTPASIRSGQTTATRSGQHPLRYAFNRLPHNKDRRCVDEAGDMLTLPPGLADEPLPHEGKTARMLKAREVQREEKWRKMAKVVAGSSKGEGMMFEFDVTDAKLVSRTWKGIPDRWRGTAWYAFLAASAKKAQHAPDEELVEMFYELQDEGSPDDVQIDVDVPRTINRHIMFRRRYRGGQRLLFRVLHAMSLYLPDTGYVQGMAALAATLLCYYEEDKAFVVLVRLWQLRGMERLYASGFEGLMDALADFETRWLRGGPVAKQLDELGITSTAYGTRWYLTLFNYSLPFPAQLRIWDVFMLLGDASHSIRPDRTAPKTSPPQPPVVSGDLDVLHATSAALIDAMRDVLVDADFENAMKALTSWIPIRDEDVLMRVVKAEYKAAKKRRGVSRSSPTG